MVTSDGSSMDIEPRCSAYADWVRYRSKLDLNRCELEDESAYHTLLRRVSAKGGRLRHVPPDGSCQFHALRDQELRGSLDDGRLRKRIVDWLRINAFYTLNNGESLCSFVAEEWNNYCARLSRSSEYGDHVTLFAAAQILEKNIEVFTTTEDERYHTVTIQCECKNVKDTLYLGLVGELHYYSISFDEPEPIPFGHATAILQHIESHITSYKSKLDECLNKDELDGLDFNVIPTLRKLVPSTSTPLKCVVCGLNGVGKSTVLNLILMLTQIPDGEYEAANKNQPAYGAAYDFAKEYFKEYITHQTNQQDIDAEVDKMIKNIEIVTDDVESQPQPNSPKTYEVLGSQRPSEDKLMNNYRDYHNGTYSTSKHWFVLPTAKIGQRGSTTNVNIRIRGAKLWMLLCIFMTEDDLVQHLCEWTPTSKSSSSTAKNHNDAIAAEIELVIGRKPTTQFTVDTFPRDQIRTEIKQNCGKRILFVGRGEDPTRDRMFIRHRLEKMMGLPKGQGNNLAAVALDEVVLFTPSWLLHSIELWETPGSGELNSRKAVALTEALETADAIMLFVSRSLETAKGDGELLLQSGVLDKLLSTRGQYPAMAIFHNTETSPNSLRHSEELVESWADEVENRKDAEQQTREALEQLFINSCNQEERSQQQQQQSSIIAETVNRIQLHCCYPMMFTSLISDMDKQVNISNTDAYRDKIEKTNGLALFHFLCHLAGNHVYNGIKQSNAAQKISMLINSINNKQGNPSALEPAMINIARGFLSKKTSKQLREKWDLISPQCKAPETFWKKIKQTLDEWKKELSKILSPFQQTVCTDRNLTQFLETHAKTMEDARKIFSPTLKGKSGAYHLSKFFFGSLRSHPDVMKHIQQLKVKIQAHREEYIAELCSFLIEQIIDTLDPLPYVHYTRQQHKEPRKSPKLQPFLEQYHETLKAELERKTQRFVQRNLETVFKRACDNSLKDILSQLTKCTNLENQLKIKFRNLAPEVFNLRVAEVHSSLQKIFKKYCTNVSEGLVNPPAKAKKSPELRNSFKSFMATIATEKKEPIIQHLQSLKEWLMTWLNQFNQLCEKLGNSETEQSEILSAILFNQASTKVVLPNFRGYVTETASSAYTSEVPVQNGLRHVMVNEYYDVIEAIAKAVNWDKSSMKCYVSLAVFANCCSPQKKTQSPFLSADEALTSIATTTNQLPVHLICGLLREMEKVLPFSISLCVDGYVTAFEIKSAEDKPTIVRVVWSIYNTFDATTEKKSQIKRVHLLPVTALKSTPLLHNPNKRNIDYVDKSSKRQKN